MNMQKNKIKQWAKDKKQKNAAKSTQLFYKGTL